jgi:hypothetical protein
MALKQLRSLDATVKANRRGLSGEWIDWYLYSGVLPATNSTQLYNWFQDSISNVTRTRTNMEIAAQLAAGKQFLAKSISVKCFNLSGLPFTAIGTGAGGPVSDAVDVMMNSLFFDIVINSKVEFEGHGQLMHNNLHYLMDAPASNLASSAYPTTAERGLTFAQPIHIMPQTNFKITGQLTTPNAATGGFTATDTCVMIILKGMMKRFT